MKKSIVVKTEKIKNLYKFLEGIKFNWGFKNQLLHSKNVYLQSIKKEHEVTRQDDADFKATWNFQLCFRTDSFHFVWVEDKFT